MVARLLALCGGIALVALLPELPDRTLLASCVVLLALLRCKYRAVAPALAFFIGLSWATGYGCLGLASRLPAEFEGVDLRVEGVVGSLPQWRTGAAQRPEALFLFDVERWLPSEPDGEVPAALERVGRLRLSWRDAPPVAPGEKWQLRLRLKRPHGSVNPGGFDYEAWLFRQGIDATGYVRSGDDNLRSAPAGWHAWDSQLRAWVDGLLMPQLHERRHAGLMRALIIGESSQLTPQEWRLFGATGTIHLMVISGLHIALVAWCCHQLGGWVGRHLLAPGLLWSAGSVAAWSALLGAFLYTALSGFALAATRALIMTAIWAAAKLLRRQIDPWFGLVLALSLVLLSDPLAPSSSGFWLSFGAVMTLMLLFQGTQQQEWSRLRRFGREWWLAQWGLFFAMLPILLWWNYSASLASPIANLLVVPLFDLLLVPLLLLATLLTPLSSTLADLLFAGGDWLLDLTDRFLHWMAASPLAAARVIQPPAWLLWLLLPALLLWLLPRTLPGRPWALLLLLPLWLMPVRHTDSEPLRLTVLDVGQGLAVVVEVGERLLIYDTGPHASERFDAGSQIIAPYLRWRGRTVIDALVVSHADRDHDGGAAGLLREVPVGRVYVSGDSLWGLQRDQIDLHPCRSGDGWRWQEVEFRFLHPDLPRFGSDNNNSCVLQIKSGDQSILLTGDIEAAAERQLLQRWGSALQATLLVAPHHGSNSSSMPDFIDAVAAKQVIFSAGYRNSYRHPHPQVVQRYAETGATLYNSAATGAVGYAIQSGGGMAPPSLARQQARRYWYDRLSASAADAALMPHESDSRKEK